MPPRKNPPTPLENFYDVGQAAVRLGFKTQAEHDAGSTKGERWLRDGCNRPEDGSKGTPFPHRRMNRQLMFSDSDLAHIADMHVYGSTQSPRRNSRQRTIRRAPEPRIPRQATPAAA